MTDLKDFDKQKAIEDFIKAGAPEVAYSIYKFPHNPDKFPELNNKSRHKVKLAIQEYEELLTVYGNEKDRMALLSRKKELKS